jgi:purine-binding chemotaxis protein CheW
MNVSAEAIRKPELDDNAAKQYLTFLLAEEEYGIDILKVREIRGWQQPTMLPNSVDYVLGVINLRGTVVPIIDLRRRFSMEKSQFGKTTVVVVVKVSGRDKDRTIGIVVDAVSEVYNVADEQVRPAPDLGGAISTEFVKGLATLDEKMIILLDIDKLISDGVLKEIEKA